MADNRWEKTLLGISIVSFALMAASFLFMPLEKETRFSGLAFWVTLLLGSGTQIALDLRRKAFFKKLRVNHRKLQKRFCGAFTFFSNIPAKIADIVLPLSAAGTALSLWLTNNTGYVCYVFIALMVLALALHCIFNGRNFFFALNKFKIFTILEQKRKSKLSKGERGRNDEK